jgi:hypothetical protein
MPGSSYAASGIALSRSCLAHTVLTYVILRYYHGKPSGDPYVVFEPYRFINDFDQLRVASRRAAAWQYDSYVHGMFAVGKLTAQTLSRPIASYDIASTLAS